MKTRLKFHSMPGDVPKSMKIAMYEGRWPERRALRDCLPMVPTITKEQSKSFKKLVLHGHRERAVLKERNRKLIEEQIASADNG